MGGKVQKWHFGSNHYSVINESGMVFMHLFSLYRLLLREISLANGILIKSSHLWSILVIPYIGGMGQDAVFMDDNARPHRARIVDTCLRQHYVTRMDWPACSPDLNPIEHVGPVRQSCPTAN